MLSENRPELARLRGKRDPVALSRWTEAFGKGEPKRSRQYEEIFSRLIDDREGGATYLGRHSPLTRRTYSGAIEEFFEWLATSRRRVTPPDEVSRKDAEDYVEWLSKRPFSLERERLRDGDQETRLAIYDAVSELGRADIVAIEERLPRHRRPPRPTLAFELGRMVLHRSLKRSPTMAELRRENPQIGIKEFSVVLPQGQVPIEEVFVYRLPEPRPVSRATIHTKLAALSRLWVELGRGDVDRPPLVKFNVWDEVLSRVSRGLEADKRASRARKRRLTPELIERLLGAVDGSTLVDKRDAALFWYLVLSGGRVSETRRILRDRPPPAELAHAPGWFEGRAMPPVVELVRKGGVHHRLPYPPYALRALYAFQATLEGHAAPRGSQSTDPRAPGYVPASSGAWRYRALSDEPDAPLFPPIGFWGANSPSQYEEFKPNSSFRPDYTKPLSSAGVAAILKKIAVRAGLSPEDMKLVHSHAFRHFAATAMAKRGKPLREIQTILGHSSVVVTEGYVETETDLTVLSGQNEILAHIASGKGAPEPVAPRGPEPIDTYAVEVKEPAEEPRVIESPKMTEATPAGEVLIAVTEETPARSEPLAHGISPGSPYYAYADIGAAPGSEAALVRETIEFTRAAPRSHKAPGSVALYEKGGKDMVQDNRFLAEHYDPWPLSYGLGSSSLLPWFARGSASSNGEVTVTVRDKAGKTKTVTVPPLPVFAAEQLYSEVKARSLWTKVEELRARWLREAPTKAFGLDRWWGAFQEVQRGLSRGTKGKWRFVPFESAAKVGDDIRAHDDDYLARWLETNADRYTTTVRAFEHIERPRGTARDDEEWAAFQEKFNQASLVGVSPAEELPEWFVSDDPVKDIYDESPEEWSWFLRWIGAITGQKLTSARSEDRKEQVIFFAKDREARVHEARELLRGYFESVESLRKATRGKEAEEAAREKETLKLLTERLGALGVPDPKVERPGLPRPLNARIEALLRIAFPDAPIELVDANILESTLFDKESFRIDESRHTIVHTDSFREDFARRYDGRDSECVMRRAARGMWEHVRRHGIPIARGTERSSDYSLLYSVMLSYIAWIVPCPEEIEARMAKEFRLSGEAARLRYLTGFRQASQRILRTTEDTDEAGLREIAREEGLDQGGAREVLETTLVQDSLRAEVALPSPPVAEAIAKTALASGHVHVVRRRPAIVVERRRAAPAPKAVATYYSVGPEEDEDEELLPNAPPARYLTPNALSEGLERLRSPGAVLPSPLRMMTAMTARF